MDSFELEMTLGELGLDAPERCKTCPRLGELVTTLSQAQHNKNFLVASTDDEILVAQARTQFAEQIAEHYPKASEAQVADLVEVGTAAWKNSEQYTATLKQAGELMRIEDATIEATMADTQSLIANCPPTGCS